MEKTKTIAAIDLGSNAVRMAIGRYEHQQLVTVFKTRAALRIGEDVFDQGMIGAKKIEKALKVFEDFAKDIKKYAVTHICAVGTSALRDATNSQAFIQLILQKTGIQLITLTGEEEAHKVFTAVVKELPTLKGPVMHMDLGGGSFEVTLANGTDEHFSHSFNFGAVRWLHLKNHASLKDYEFTIFDEAQAMSQWVVKHLQLDHVEGPLFVTTGGNFRAILKIKEALFGPGDTVKFEEMKKILLRLQCIEPKEQARRFDIREDRADVLVVSLEFLVVFFALSKISQFRVLRVSLKEGLMLSMLDAPSSALEFTT